MKVGEKKVRKLEGRKMGAVVRERGRGGVQLGGKTKGGDCC